MIENPTSKAVTLQQLLPIRSWIRTPILRRSSSLLFAIFAGYPLLAGWFISQQFEPVAGDGSGGAALAHDLKWLDWPFVAYFGAAWLVGLWLIVRPRLAMYQATAVALMALIVEGPIAVWLETTFNARTTNLFSAVFVIGGSEEFAKLVPLLVVVGIAAGGTSARLRGWLDLSPRGYLYLGCLSGVVFGCSEAVEYIVGTQNGVLNGQGNAYALTEVVFLRLITDPINHALWAGVAGFFVGLAVQRARRSSRTGLAALFEQSWLILIGLAVAATLHGINDFAAANAAVQALIDLASALLLLGYAVAGDEVEQAVLTTTAPQWGHRIAAAARQAAQPSAYPQPNYAQPAYPQPNHLPQAAYPAYYPQPQYAPHYVPQPGPVPAAYAPPAYAPPAYAPPA